MVGEDARGKMVRVRPVAREVVPVRVASQGRRADLEVREAVPDRVVNQDNQVDLVAREVDRGRVDSPVNPVVDVVLSDHNVLSSL